VKELKFRLVTKTRHVTDPQGRRYICQQFEPDCWWVGRVDSRKWLAQEVTWRDVKTLVSGQLPLF
jgi:hypothetical protein